MKRLLTITLTLTSLTILTQYAEGSAYPNPGWKYFYDGDQAVCGSGAFDSLDGTWNRNNGSSEWDCSAPGGAVTASDFPGGVASINNGTHASEVGINYLRIQDCGNPNSYSGLANNGCGGCTISGSANRKMLFVHDMTAEGIQDTFLDDGFTITFRARIPTPAKTTVALSDLYPVNETASGPQPYPANGDGVIIQDNANGCISARQLAGGKIGFSLVTSNDTLGGLTATPKANFMGLQINGLNGNTANNNIDFNEANTLNVLPLDPTEWNEFWIVVTKDDSGLGTHLVLVYTNGSSSAQIFHVTAATSGGEQSSVSHIEMGSSQTAQSGAVDLDFLGYTNSAIYPPGAGGPPPVISSVVPLPPGSGNTFWPKTNGVSFAASTSSSTIDPSGILLVLNGSNVSSGLVIGGTPTARTASYNGLVDNVIYTGQIQVTDAGGSKATFPLKFDTLIDANPLVIDTEDYNHDAGQFSDSSAPNGYAAFSGTEGIDFHDVTPTVLGAYRGSDGVDTVASTDTTRQRFTDAGATSDYDVGTIEQGEWLNYTRTFPAGKYIVYLRYFATVSQTVKFDLVTGNRTQPNQTTFPIGSFAANASGGAYTYAQLRDGFGNPLVINLSGVQTVRLTSPDARLNLRYNFLIFVPATGANLAPIISYTSPAPNSSNAPPDTSIQIVIENRDTGVVPGSINYRFDGTDVTGSSTISSTANGAVISYQPPSQLALNSLHTNRVVFTNDAGTPVSFTNQWSFRIANLPTLQASWATAPGSGINPGFNDKIHYNDNGQDLIFPNTATRGENQVAGLLIDVGTGMPFPNQAPGPNNDGTYTETGVINYSNDGTDRGSFSGDRQFPNIDPMITQPDHVAMAVTADLDLTAGIHRFGVRCNDGFKLSSGPDFTRSGAYLPLGSFESFTSGNDGTGTTEFDFVVPTAGVYPFRLIWFQCTGPSDLEWYSVDRTTGAISLINSNNPGAVPAYQSRPLLPLTSQRIVNTRMSGTNVLFDYQTFSGYSYYVDYKDVLSDSWTLGVTPFAGDGGIDTFSAPANIVTKRYYRIRGTYP